MATLQKDYNFKNKNVNDSVKFNDSVKKWNGKNWVIDQDSTTTSDKKELLQIISLSNNLDLSTGDVFTKTIIANTTFTLSNPPVAGEIKSIILELTNAGSKTITWWNGIKWEGGVVPVLTSLGVDILGFYTYDAGVTWRGIVLVRDSK